MMPDQLQARLGHAFADRRLLEEALTHRSFGQPNNERFEFLGDAILDCVVSIALFGRFGELREGELSRVRASLVRQDTLHRLALELELGDCLRLGEGELKSGGSRRPTSRRQPGPRSSSFCAASAPELWTPRARASWA